MPKEPQDPLTELLKKAPTSDAVRASAWDAFESAANEDDLAAKLQTLALPQHVKAQLWDLKASTKAAAVPAHTTARPEDFTPSAEPEGSATSRFLTNAGEMLNPVAIGKGLYDAVTSPIDTLTNVASAQLDQGKKAYETARHAQQPADYLAALGHAGAAVLPVLGPAAAAAGEQIGSGDIAGGLGKGAGLLVPTAIPTAVRGTVKAANKYAPNGVVTALEEGAASRVADVISPKVGQNKVRLGNQAEKIAPTLAKDLAADGAPLTRSGFHAEVRTKLAAAEQALDSASDARLSARTFPTKPLIDALLEKRKALTAEAVEGSRAVPTVKGAGGTPTPSGMTRNVSSGRMQPKLTKEGRPIGQDVVPGPNAPRVAAIDQAIKELRQLGPVTRYDPIRTIRQAYDGQAKAVYSPAVTADYLAQRGSALGAADVTGTLRDALAKWDPPTATANAQYSLYRTADDVLSATAEVERTRPKIGRQIIARMTGSVLGNQAAGIPGAAAGYIAGPLVDSALASGATTQLKTAALMTKLATAIRRGDVGAVNTITSQVKRIGATAAAVVGNATSPSGQSMQPMPATR
jgi:hypothetical protein